MSRLNLLKCLQSPKTCINIKCNSWELHFYFKLAVMGFSSLV
ncbi:hypothetical protein [Vibrio phage vB_VpaS_CHI]|nr:hypothetical protein [Vibrio phage vB_VpaS_ALK]USL90139.1 hypothetical protein [Vibrio phage vB_VpaS_CHI]